MSKSISSQSQAKPFMDVSQANRKSWNVPLKSADSSPPASDVAYCNTSKCKFNNHVPAEVLTHCRALQTLSQCVINEIRESNKQLGEQLISLSPLLL